MKAKSVLNGSTRESDSLSGEMDRTKIKVLLQASELIQELGTPLNVLSGRAEFLLNATQEEQTRRGLKTILEQAERLTQMRAQLLECFGRTLPR